MKRMLVLVVAVGVVTASAALTAGAADEKAPTIKDVMRKLHKGANSPLARLKTQLRADPANWETIEKTTKDFVILGASLSKNDPPKGEASSWKRLSGTYYADAKALDDAAVARDKTAAQAAYQRLSASCKACHAAHKGQ